MNLRLNAKRAVLAMVLLLNAERANAVLVYWDTNGASTGASGGATANGTWDAATTGNWSTNLGGTAATSNYATANGGSPTTADVIFSAGSNATGNSTVTINAQGTATGVTANSITVEEGRITSATSGTFTQTATGGRVIALGAGGLTISNTASGASSFNSNTTVGLLASQTWTNNGATSGESFTASGGISSIAAGTQTLTLRTTSAGGITIGGVISDQGTAGTGAVAVTRDGASAGLEGISGTRVSLSAANTYSGNTTVFGGRLRASNTGAIPSGAGKGDVFITNNGGNTSALELNAAGTFNINGLNGNGFVVHGAAVGSEITLAVGNNNASGNFSGVIRQEAPSLTDRIFHLTKVGTGTQILSGANIYTGTTAINAGTLEFAQRVSFYNAEAGILAGYWTNTSKWSVGSGAVAAFRVGGSGEFDSTDIQTLLGVGDGSGGFKNGSSIGLDTTSGDFTYSNVVANPNGGSNALGLAKLGTNTLSLTAANTYSGTTTVVGGTLKLSDTNALQNSTLTTGGIVFDQAVVSNAFTLGGLTGSGAITLENDAAAAVAVSIGNNIANTTYSGDLSGSGSITKVGTGKLTLKSPNSTFSGGIIVSAGALDVDGVNSSGSVLSGPLGTGTLTLDGGKFIPSSNVSNIIANSVALNDVSTNTIEVTSNAGSASVLSGNITGAGGFTKTGTGILVLSGNNTYAGATTVSAGTLGFAQRVSFYDAEAGGLANYWTDTSKWSVEFGAVAAFSVGGSGEFDSGDIQTISGVGDGSGGFKNGSFIALDTTSGDFTYSNVIANPNGGSNLLNFAKSGTNTLSLAAANTFSGTTSVVGGTLKLSHTNALQNSTLTTGGIAFDSAVSSNEFTLGGLSGSGAISLQNDAGSPAPVALSVGNNDADTSRASVISGSGSLIKIGTGSLTLTGANTFSGGVTVSGGTFIAGANAAAGTGTLTLNGGALRNTGGNRSLSNPIDVVASTTNSIYAVGGSLTMTGKLTGSGTIDNSLDPGSDSRSVSFQGDISEFEGTFIHNRVVGSSDTDRFQGTTAASQDGSRASFVLNGSAASHESGPVFRVGAFDGATFKMGALSGTGNVIRDELDSDLADQDMTLEVGHLDSDTSFAGVIDDQEGAFNTTMSFVKVGDGELTLSGNNYYKGTTSVMAGTLLVNGSHTPDPGDVFTIGAYTVADGATLGGTGSISSSVTVDSGGTLSPGASIGTFSVGVDADIDGTLLIEYDGDDDTIDLLTVTGALDITNATLEFENLEAGALDGEPHIFASYGSLTGIEFFDVIGKPTDYDIDYNYNNLNQIALVASTALDGDYNGNSVVDGADYVLWRMNYPNNSTTATVSMGDGTGDGNVLDDDYDYWRERFGNLPSGSSTSAALGANTAVPEPGTCGLLLWIGLSLAGGYHRRWVRRER